MSVHMYFGLPGSGKTTFATYLAIEEQKRIEKGISCFDYVFTNFPVNYPGIYKTETSDLGTVEIARALLVLDEATLVADSRDYKSFSHEMKEFFLMHRHFRCDCYLFSQQFDGVDKKIRNITEKLFYVHRGAIRRWISYAMPIPTGYIIPEKKKSDDEKYGEIVQGYCKGKFIQRVFEQRIKRKKYYQYFDSYAVPKKYKPNPYVMWCSLAVSESESSETAAEKI